MKFGTEIVSGHEFRDQFGSHIPPIYVSAVYEYIDSEGGLAVYTDRGTYVRYGREENPMVRALERVLSKIEMGADALVFNSGMAAELALFLHFIKPGSKVIVPYEVYSTTLLLLEKLSEKMNFKLIKVWPSARSIIESYDENTSMIFLEVMTNPTLKVIDLLEVCEEIGGKALLIVDNTFTTPILLKPLKHCASIVVHSLTKYIAGHNDVVGGALISKTPNIFDLWDWRRITGGIIQALEAYLVLRGLKTLEVRFEKQSKTALEIAEFLSEHPRVEEVYYPGLTSSPYHSVADKLFERKLYGGVVAFKVKGGYREAVEFLKKLKVIKRAPSLGGTESLAVLPAKAGSMFIPEDARLRLGITENLVRLSIGLEDPEDLREDLDQALK
ncbi:MAG: cystathionine gamma-synthase family protein [Desulfurococcaceae archaeon]|mgnify:CR=1 FL=1